MTGTLWKGRAIVPVSNRGFLFLVSLSLLVADADDIIPTKQYRYSVLSIVGIIIHCPYSS